ncbi:MAG: hypothetical protein HY290_22760 [Planctomycetia bacterium]|nr:hypothetical protein [Planctomycetia bacterium]
MPAAPDFIKTFHDRRQCFAELLALSERQLGLVESDDYTQLLGVLGGKQQIIGRLEAIAGDAPRLWDDWRRERDRLPQATRDACEQTLAETQSLLERLLEHERVSTETLSRRRDETQAQLRSVTGGARVNQAYRDSLSPLTHRLLDRDL